MILPFCAVPHMDPSAPIAISTRLPGITCQPVGVRLNTVRVLFITHGLPAGSTAILKAPPSTFVHPLPFHLDISYPPCTGLPPIIHTLPSAPTAMSDAPPGFKLQLFVAGMYS